MRNHTVRRAPPPYVLQAQLFSPSPLESRAAKSIIGNNMAVMEPVANTGAFDCTFLDEISEETILENLRLRFKIGKVKS